MTEPKSPEGNPNVEPSSTPEPKTEVSYETHRKLLSEKKKLQERYAEKEAKLKEFEAAQEAAAEQKLIDAKDYATLKANAEQRALDAEKKFQAIEAQITDAKKLNAVLDGVQGSVSKKFFGMIDTSGIVVDPETGEMDPSTIAKAVETFQENFPEIIQTKGNNFPASNAPAGKNKEGSLSMKDYLALSKADRKKNIHLLDLPDEAKFLL